MADLMSPGLGAAPDPEQPDARPADLQRPRGWWRRGRRADAGFSNALIWVGSGLLLLVVLAAVFAPLLSSWGPLEIDPLAPRKPPSSTHLLGTDANGMDVWSRVLHAARLDLGIAVAAVTLGVLLGTAIGLFAGYRGGWFDDVVMRIVDIFQAFPTFILALAVAALLGNSSINLIITLAVVYAPAYARLIRAEARTVRESPFVEAAVVSGTATGAILWRHLLPNCLTPVRVIGPLNCGWAILTLAGLSFLGLGVPVPTAEWGAMINLGASDVVAGRWWTSVPPGIALIICVLGFSLLGEGLQDRAARWRS